MGIAGVGNARVFEVAVSGKPSAIPHNGNAMPVSENIERLLTAIEQAGGLEPSVEIRLAVAGESNRARELIYEARKVLLHVNYRIGDGVMPFFGDDEHELLNELDAYLAEAHAGTAEEKKP